MFDKTKQMDLGDIFSNTFKLFSKTFTRNIIIAAAFLVPAGLIMAYGFDSFFSAVMETARKASETRFEDSKPDFTSLFANIGLYFFALLVFLLANLAVLIGITKISWDQINDERTDVGEAFKKIFSITFLKTLVQSLLLMIALFACVFIGFMIIIVGASSQMVLITVLGVLTLIAGIVFCIYLVFRWYFASIAIICEDRDIFGSFSKSTFLVQGNWWRTFGIIILFSILVDFAISIITTPVYFVVMWDFISWYFKMISEGMIDQNDPEMVFRMMQSFGWGFGVVIIFTVLLDALITPLFNVVYYFDLKIRKNDFDNTPATDNLNTEGFTLG